MSADDPAKRSEYLGVLKQKTQWLKTLTESLTEAAKASSGSLPALIVIESKDESGNAVPILINSDGRHISGLMVICSRQS